MPVFNTNILRPGYSRPASGGGGYSSTMANSELEVLSNKLAEDGNLSSADYDTLITKARELQTKFNLGSSSGRNAVASLDATISNYELDKQQIEDRRFTDVDRMNREIEDDRRNIAKNLSNDPENYLKASADSLKIKLQNLKQSIEYGQENGSDVSSYVNEYNKTIDQWGNYNDLLGQLQNGVSSGLGAYVKTNGKGEITDIDYAPIGSSRIGKTIETDSTYNGIRVFIRPNGQRNGQNYARLGRHTFTEDPLQVPVPVTDDNGNFSGFVSYKFKKGTESGDVSANDFSYSTYLNQGQWAQGINGSLYQNVDGSTYQKYSGYKFEDLGIEESDVVPLSQELEKRINQNVVGHNSPMTKMTPADTEKILSSPKQPLNISGPYTPIPKEQLQGSLDVQSSRQSSPPAVQEQSGNESFFGRVKRIFTGNF